LIRGSRVDNYLHGLRIQPLFFRYETESRAARNSSSLQRIVSGSAGRVFCPPESAVSVCFIRSNDPLNASVFVSSASRARLSRLKKRKDPQDIYPPLTTKGPTTRHYQARYLPPRSVRIRSWGVSRSRWCLFGLRCSWRLSEAAAASCPPPRYAPPGHRAVPRSEHPRHPIPMPASLVGACLQCRWVAYS